MLISALLLSIVSLYMFQKYKAGGLCKSWKSPKGWFCLSYYCSTGLKSAEHMMKLNCQFPLFSYLLGSQSHSLNSI